MAKLILLAILTFSVFAGTCQKKKAAAIENLFSEAEEQLHDSSYDEAIASYKQIIKKASTWSTAYCRATFNLGYTYYMQKNDKAAEKVFTQIITNEEEFDDMERGGRGEGLGQEPYALYKHNACEILAEIELNRNNYTKALEYIHLFDKTYPYQHFCGNELAASQLYTAEMYSRAYTGLHDTTNAIRSLLPYIFDNDLAPNDEIVKRAVNLLQARYNKQYLVTELDNAINKLEVKNAKDGKMSYEIYQIIFLEVPVQVPENFHIKDENQNKPELEKRKLTVKESDFYKKITS